MTNKLYLFMIQVRSHTYGNKVDGTPCAVKAARTVRGGGKSRDDVKALPITIVYGIAITAMVRRVVCLKGRPLAV